jgi:hypothetical protein
MLRIDAGLNGRRLHMSMRKWLVGAAVAAAACTGWVVAQDAKKTEGGESHGQSAQPEMSPEQQKMMEAWMKASTPGEHHGHLKFYEGEWDQTMKWRMAPEAPWEESGHTCTFEWMLGGRFLHGEVKGKAPMPEMGGGIFEGHSVLGYDNAAGKYISIWLDNMGTGVWQGTGACDADKKTITIDASYTDAMTGKPKASKAVYTITGPDTYTMEFWEAGPDGKQFQSGVISATRVKKAG